MKPLAYLHLQMRLEGKEIASPCFIKQVEAVPGEEVPLMLIAQLATGGVVVYYDEQISADLQNELAASTIDIVFSKMDPPLEILKKHNVQFEIGYYRTYVFPSKLVRTPEVICLSKQDPKVKMFGFDGLGEEVHALELENRIVSACVSARENQACGEAWVYTEPAYRHRGFAQKVVRAWAGSLMVAGKIPFYSHSIENAASANLAKKLGLQPVFEEISITQISKDEHSVK